jgi:hypothetical protein
MSDQTTQVDIVMPSMDQARIRFRELANATRDVEGVRVLAGYRCIIIGGLTINVSVA